MIRISPFLLLVCLWVPAHVRAFIDPPAIEPAQPLAGQVVSVLIRAGICDAFLDDPDQTDISINGSAIDLLVDGIRRTDPILCMFNPYTWVYPIGAFPPGNYTLTIRMRHTPFGLPTVVEVIGEIAFTVEGTPVPPTPVPSLGALALMALTFCILLGGLISERENCGFMCHRRRARKRAT